MSPASVGVRLGHWCGAASAMAARGDGESDRRPSSSAELTESRFVRAVTAGMRLLLFVVVRLAVRCRRRPIAPLVTSRPGDCVLLIAAAAEAATAGPAPPVPPPSMSSIQLVSNPGGSQLVRVGSRPAKGRGNGGEDHLSAGVQWYLLRRCGPPARQPCFSCRRLSWPHQVCRIVGLKYGKNLIHPRSQLVTREGKFWNSPTPTWHWFCIKCVLRPPPPANVRSPPWRGGGGACLVTKPRKDLFSRGDAMPRMT